MKIKYPEVKNYTVEEILRFERCDGTSSEFTRGFVTGFNRCLLEIKNEDSMKRIDKYLKESK